MLHCFLQKKGKQYAEIRTKAARAARAVEQKVKKEARKQHALAALAFFQR
jgi:hypothetical protein